MIDQCINAVFQRDQRVFIPGFGAVIYSEATDRSYFNEHLTLDDGKVVEEIQRQERLSPEESKDTLTQYIQSIQEALKDKGYYFIGGIGYLSMDERGGMTLAKTKEDALPGDTAIDEEVPQNEPVEPAVIPSPLEDETEEDDFGLETSEIPGEPGEESQPLPGFEEQDDFDDESPDEEKPNYDTILSEEDEGVQDYYKRKARYEKKRPAFNVLWIFIPLLIIGLVALYYFQFYQQGQGTGTGESKSQTSLDLQASTVDAANAHTAKSEEVPPRKVVETENSMPAHGENEGADQSKKTTRDEPEAKISAKTLPIIEQHSSDPRVYSVILGSFKYEPYADRLANRLRNQGLEVSKFAGHDNFYFVGFEKIKGKDSALSLLEDMRNQREPYAWITRK